MADDVDSLCVTCALCCDGSLFGRASLAPGERERLAGRGLRILPSGTSFEQPCSALGPGPGPRSCSVYADRPATCRRFSCALRERTLGGGSLGDALEVVRRTRALLQKACGGPEALSADDRAELEASVATSFQRA